MIKVILQIIVSFSLSYLILKLLLKYVKESFLDQPNSSRKQHAYPIPRFGGLGFVFAIFTAILATNNFSSISTWYFIGALLIWILGTVDDSINLNWAIKLCVQILVGVLLFINVITSISFPEIFLTSQLNIISMALFLVVWLVWFLGMTNAVNLCDGLDGLAASMMVISSIGLCFFGLPSLHLIIAASLVGFLIFNKYPAKLYMGDSGSLFLGYHLAIVPVLFATQTQLGSIDIGAYLIMNTYFIWDTTRVVIARLLLRKSPFQPDQSHYHFMLIQRGCSINVAVARICIIHFYFVLCASLICLIGYQVFTVIIISIGICYLLYESFNLQNLKAYKYNASKPL